MVAVGTREENLPIPRAVKLLLGFQALLLFASPVPVPLQHAPFSTSVKIAPLPPDSWFLFEMVPVTDDDIRVTFVLPRLVVFCCDWTKPRPRPRPKI